jgi:hypothetical protein
MPPHRSTRFPIGKLLCLLFGIGGIAGGTAVHLAGNQSLSDVRLVLYVLLPIILGCIFVGLLAAGHSLRAIVLTIAFACGAGTLAAETFLALNPQHIRISFAPSEAPNSAPKRPVDPDLRFACPSALPNGGIPGDSPAALILPLGGMRGAPLGDGRDADEHGFNNPEGQWQADTIDVLTVGDSFTFGADVPIGSGFADQLREGGRTLVNLGCGGNGPLAELGTLLEYGPKLRPRHVIWAYYEENDLPKDIVDELGSSILIRYLDGTTQNLVERQPEIDRALRSYLSGVTEATTTSAGGGNLLGFARDIVLLRSLRSAIGLVNGFAPRNLATFKNILQQARRVAGSWGGTLIFVYLPGPTRYLNPIARLDADGYKSAVLTAVDESGIRAVDIDAAFRKRDRPLALFRGHYTQEGYRIVAEEIRRILDDRIHSAP